MENENRNENNPLQYYGIGFQIAGVIAVGVFIGYQLDKWMHTAQPYFTIGFGAAFIVIAIYLGFKQFIKE